MWTCANGGAQKQLLQELQTKFSVVLPEVTQSMEQNQDGTRYIQNAMKLLNATPFRICYRTQHYK